MTLDEYQQEAMKSTLPLIDNNITYLALALCGECGEAADKIKKVIRNKDGRFYQSDMYAIALELGDVLWYLSVLAKALGFTLTAIAEMNIDKIDSRIKNDTLHGAGDNR